MVAETYDDWIALTQNSLCRYRLRSVTLESMKERPLLPSLFIVLFVTACPLSRALADTPQGAPQAQAEPQQPTTRQYNTRLPPVMPGEEIVTETGQRMRVWSSAGPVPVNPRPTPQTLYGNGNGSGNAPSVIIDGRIKSPFGDKDRAP